MRIPHPLLFPVTALVLAFPAAGLANDDFNACVQGLQQTATEAGIGNATLHLADLKQQTRVLELDKSQPEFFQTFWQYLDTRVSERRIERGRELLEENRALLERVEKEFGVRPQYLVALWGLETNFGSFFGRMPVIDSLATLACDPRRSAYFTSELLEALRILEAGHIKRDAMEGSWAGAMGHTQFMPSTFNAYAIDYDNSGRIDLWNSLPDAFGSSARYLRAMGWEPDQRWGREVSLPGDFAWDLAGMNTRKSLEEWADEGVLQADGGALPVMPGMRASLLLPAGHKGPAFLVYDNFRHIMRWNASTSYALAVGHLADRIAGMGPLVATKPSDERPLRREEVEEIQATLNRLGYESGPPDGVVGPMTRQAVRGYQLERSLPADGYPDVFLLNRLRDNGE